MRILAATHRDLEQAIQDKQFREDLYYRLTAVVIKLPPLRERAEDLPALADYFLRRFAGELNLQPMALPAESLAWLQQQRWPGNVRQLENVLREALPAARGFAISTETLEQVVHKRAASTSSASTMAASPQSLESLMDDLLQQAKAGADLDVHARVFAAMERELFTRAIALAQGNQAKAARWLKISRQTMREKLQLFGLKEPADKDGADERGA